VQQNSTRLLDGGSPHQASAEAGHPKSGWSRKRPGIAEPHPGAADCPEKSPARRPVLAAYARLYIQLARDFQWDPEKARSNLPRHRVDSLMRCGFSRRAHALLTIYPRARRFVTLGWTPSDAFASFVGPLVYDDFRIISHGVPSATEVHSTKGTHSHAQAIRIFLSKVAPVVPPPPGKTASRSPRRRSARVVSGQVHLPAEGTIRRSSTTRCELSSQRERSPSRQSPAASSERN